MIKKIIAALIVILLWENRHTIAEHIKVFWYEGVAISQNG